MSLMSKCDFQLRRCTDLPTIKLQKQEETYLDLGFIAATARSLLLRFPK